MKPKQSFKRWMYFVDHFLIQKIGKSSSDLPDFNYRELYEQDVAPKHAASKAIRTLGGI